MDRYTECALFRGCYNVNGPLCMGCVEQLQLNRSNCIATAALNTTVMKTESQKESHTSELPTWANHTVQK